MEREAISLQYNLIRLSVCHFPLFHRAVCLRAVPDIPVLNKRRQREHLFHLPHLSLCFSPILFLSRFAYLFPSLTHSVSLSASVSLFLSHSVSVCLSVCPSASQSLSFSFLPCLSFSMASHLSLSLYLQSLSFTFFTSTFLIFGPFFSICLYVSPSLLLSSLALSQSLSIFLQLPF